MKIVCDDRIPYLRGVLEPYAEVVYKGGAVTRPEDVRDADAVVTRTRTDCGARLLAGSRVRMLATATVGYDHIDTSWCGENGIRWENAPGCNSASVCQYVASAICVLARRYGLDLKGMTLGIAGAGNVGSKVARVGELLGMKVLLCDPPRAEREGPDAFTDLDGLCRRSDIITLHVPLEREGPHATYHLFGRERLEGLEGKILINSSRGPVVDNAALSEMLERGRMKAVLDVWENEPDPDRKLLGLTDIATPHIAGYSADGKALGTAMAVRALARFFGLPLEDWYPESIPAPENGLEIDIDAAALSGETVLQAALCATYDIMKDDAALRGDPEGFEYQRGHYPVRRETPAYTVNLHNAGPAEAEVLEKAGFNVRLMR